MEYYSQPRRALLKRKLRSKKPLVALSSDSSDSSASSSVILSMCPLSLNEKSYPFVNINKKSSTNSSQQSLCNLCGKNKTFNQCKTCEKPDEKNKLLIKSDSMQLLSTTTELKRTYSFSTISAIEHIDGARPILRKIERAECENIESKLTNNNDDDKLSLKSKNIKKAYHQRIKHLLKLPSNLESSSDSSIAPAQSCLHRLLIQPELSSETEQIEKLEFNTEQLPIYIPTRIELSAERLDRFKQRQTDLDRSVQKLIDNSSSIINENLRQVSKHWSYIKHTSLEKYQPSTYSFQLFDYLIKSSYMNKQFQIDFNENDEIKAVLEILSQTLTLVHDKISFTMMNQLFDDEEKTMLENLRYQYELLFSSYKDELSFIRERSHFYQLNLDEEKKFNWIQLIQIDYPFLIEKISTDFMIKIPQIEQILLQMLRNLNKQLLKDYIYK